MNQGLRLHRLTPFYWAYLLRKTVDVMQKNGYYKPINVFKKSQKHQITEKDREELFQLILKLDNGDE